MCSNIYIRIIQIIPGLFEGIKSNFQTKVNGKDKNGHFWYVHFSNIEVFS
jgi:hypothetical protein